MKHKVLAYIIRRYSEQLSEQLEVLVFIHKDFPEAGIQVPAGTVEPDEPLVTALFREIEEESGISPQKLQLLHKIAQCEIPEQNVVRHVYMLTPTEELPDTWSHCVGGVGKDNGLIFDYYWSPVDITLAGGQSQWLSVAIEYYGSSSNNLSMEQA